MRQRSAEALAFAEDREARKVAEEKAQAELAAQKEAAELAEKERLEAEEKAKAELAAKAEETEAKRKSLEAGAFQSRFDTDDAKTIVNNPNLSASQKFQALIKDKI